MTVGAFIAVNAPTLLSVLWKVIRGWLNEEIKSLVHVNKTKKKKKQNALHDMSVLIMEGGVLM